MERRRDVKTFKEKREKERGGMEEERGREKMRRHLKRRD